MCGGGIVMKGWLNERMTVIQWHDVKISFCSRSTAILLWWWLRSLHTVILLFLWYMKKRESRLPVSRILLSFWHPWEMKERKSTIGKSQKMKWRSFDFRAENFLQTTGDDVTIPHNSLLQMLPLLLYLISFNSYMTRATLNLWFNIIHFIYLLWLSSYPPTIWHLMSEE